MKIRISARPGFAMIVLSLCIVCGVRYGAAQTGAPADTAKSAWFSVREVADRVWRIDDHGSDNMYLVAGNDTALLIDAGTGVADLAACIKSITPLPVVVVNTHGHPDHCGSDFQFPEVHASASDFEAIKFFSSGIVHHGQIEQAEQRFPDLAASLMKDTSEVKMPGLIPVAQGFVFNLGGRSLEVIETPGHTKGSLCLLDAKNGLLFTGDNDNTLVWLFLKECLPLERYLQTLQYLKERSGEFTTLLPGHGDRLDSQFIDDQIGCVQQILSGDCKDEPYTSFAGEARVCYYKRAGVAFNPENLRAAQK